MDILTLSPKTTFQKNNCYRSTTLLFGIGQTIVMFNTLKVMQIFLKCHVKLGENDEFSKLATGIT